MRTYQKKHDKETRTTTMRFDSALYARMQARAEERGVSLSALVHEAVRRDMDAPTAGGGYLAQIDRLVGSGRDPVLTITATLGETRAYHGRVDVERWAEFRGYGKLPLLLTFEYEKDPRALEAVSATEVAFAHVNAIVEDPGASYFRELTRPEQYSGYGAAKNENAPAYSRVCAEWRAAYVNEVTSDFDAATSVRDLYARLQARVETDGDRFLQNIMGPRLYGCSRATYEKMLMASTFFDVDVGSPAYHMLKKDCEGVEPASGQFERRPMICWFVPESERAAPGSNEVEGWFKVQVAECPERKNWHEAYRRWSGSKRG